MMASTDFRREAVAYLATWGVALNQRQFNVALASLTSELARMWSLGYRQCRLDRTARNGEEED